LLCVCLLCVLAMCAWYVCSLCVLTCACITRSLLTHRHKSSVVSSDTSVQLHLACPLVLVLAPARPVKDEPSVDDAESQVRLEAGRAFSLLRIA